MQSNRGMNQPGRDWNEEQNTQGHSRESYRDYQDSGENQFQAQGRQNYGQTNDRDWNDWNDNTQRNQSGWQQNTGGQPQQGLDMNQGQRGYGSSRNYNYGRSDQNSQYNSRYGNQYSNPYGGQYGNPYSGGQYGSQYGAGTGSGYNQGFDINRDQDSLDRYRGERSLAQSGFYGSQYPQDQNYGSNSSQGSMWGNRGGSQYGNQYDQRNQYDRSNQYGYNRSNYGERNYGRSNYGPGTGHSGNFGVGMSSQGTNDYSNYGSYNWGSGYMGSQGMQDHRGRGPKGYRRSDERITEDINDRLSDDRELDASNIEVKVDEGVVTLSGTVDDRHAKRRAEDIAESISGVSNVENRIRVGDMTTGSSSSSGKSSSSSATSSLSSQASKQTQDHNGHDRVKAKA